jgi:hypothetical protein
LIITGKNSENMKSPWTSIKVFLFLRINELFYCTFKK